MSTSRGIKVIAVLAFIALFAPCLSLTSYAQSDVGSRYSSETNPSGVGGEWGAGSLSNKAGNFVEPYPVFCRECSKSYRFDHQKALAGGEWARNSMTNVKLDADAVRAIAKEPCQLTPGRNGDAGF